MTITEETIVRMMIIVTIESIVTIETIGTC